MVGFSSALLSRRDALHRVVVTGYGIGTADSFTNTSSNRTSMKAIGLGALMQLATIAGGRGVAGATQVTRSWPSFSRFFAAVHVKSAKPAHLAHRLPTKHTVAVKAMLDHPCS